MSEPRGEKNPRILCAGGAVQDIVMRVDKFPDAGTRFRRQFLIIGGQAETLRLRARLGGHVSLPAHSARRTTNLQTVS